VRAGRISNDAQPAHVHNRRDVFHYLGAERFGFPGCGFDVIDENVRKPERWCARDWVLHHAAASSLSDADHGVIAGNIFELPVEKFAIKIF